MCESAIAPRVRSGFRSYFHVSGSCPLNPVGGPGGPRAASRVPAAAPASSGSMTASFPPAAAAAAAAEIMLGAGERDTEDRCPRSPGTHTTPALPALPGWPTGPAAPGRPTPARRSAVKFGEGAQELRRLRGGRGGGSGEWGGVLVLGAGMEARAPPPARILTPALAARVHVLQPCPVGYWGVSGG